ncbi:MAG: hypothetical protein P4L82_07415, partial [Ancalomicrobiaceae bacterium]|nr:hypothetical protein [Ancalomicrobiaceae bacterium]
PTCAIRVRPMAASSRAEETSICSLKFLQREREISFRHCERSEAIQKAPKARLDCFAALAIVCSGFGIVRMTGWSKCP